MNPQPRPHSLRLRRAIASILRFALRFRAAPYQPPTHEHGNALVIAPHPDDETFGCGGWIARQTADGRPVHVLFLTDGSASHPGHPTVAPREIQSLRATEARAAASTLGVAPANLHFLGLPDGQLARLDPAISLAASRQLRSLLLEISPGEILLPCHNDGSTEHEAAFQLVSSALSDLPASPRVLEFPVWSWWSPRFAWRLIFSRARILRCHFPRQRGAKRAAMGCYRSQTEPLPPWKHSALPEGFVALFSAPEEYFFEN
ncbi:MAG: PIG-L family deacetylase [Nibricoccus sp.]